MIFIRKQVLRGGKMYSYSAATAIFLALVVSCTPSVEIPAL